MYSHAHAHTPMNNKDTRCLVLTLLCCCHSRGSGQALSLFVPLKCSHCTQHNDHSIYNNYITYNSVTSSSTMSWGSGVKEITNDKKMFGSHKSGFTLTGQLMTTHHIALG